MLRGCEETGTLHIADGIVRWRGHFRKCLTAQNVTVTIWPIILVCTQENGNTFIQKLYTGTSPVYLSSYIYALHRDGPGLIFRWGNWLMPSGLSKIKTQQKKKTGTWMFIEHYSQQRKVKSNPNVYKLIHKTDYYLTVEKNKADWHTPQFKWTLTDSSLSIKRLNILCFPHLYDVSIRDKSKETGKCHCSTEGSKGWGNRIWLQ